MRVEKRAQHGALREAVIGHRPSVYEHVFDSEGLCRVRSSIAASSDNASGTATPARSGRPVAQSAGQIAGDELIDGVVPRHGAKVSGWVHAAMSRRRRAGVTGANEDFGAGDALRSIACVPGER